MENDYTWILEELLGEVQSNTEAVEALREVLEPNVQRVSDIVSAIPFLLGTILGAIIIHEFFRRF